MEITFTITEDPPGTWSVVVPEAAPKIRDEFQRRVEVPPSVITATTPEELQARLVVNMTEYVARPVTVVEAAWAAGTGIIVINTDPPVGY